jgi:hypothetical protein
VRRVGSGRAPRCAASSGRSSSSAAPGSGSRDPRVSYETESQQQVHRARDADPRTGHDPHRALAARIVGQVDPGTPGCVDSVIGERDPEISAQTAGSGRVSLRPGRGSSGPQEYRLPGPRDEVRANDLVDPEHIEGSGRQEHRAVPDGRATDRVAGGVVRHVRFHLDQPDRTVAARVPDVERATEQVPGHAHGGPGEERPPEASRGVRRGVLHGPRVVRRPRRPSPPRSSARRESGRGSSRRTLHSRRSRA